MSAALLDKVARYCIFSGFDSTLTVSVCGKVIKALRRQEALTDAHRPQWIREIRSNVAKAKNLGRELWTDSKVIPSDFVAWKAFFNSTEAVESEAVLLSQILKFTDSEIAWALGVSEGTVRYRTGHGLRKLGGYIAN